MKAKDSNKQIREKRREKEEEKRLPGNRIAQREARDSQAYRRMGQDVEPKAVTGSGSKGKNKSEEL